MESFADRPQRVVRLDDVDVGGRRNIDDGGSVCRANHGGGGRSVTTGAESDLEQVTAIARQMIGRWGMSEAVGPITVLPNPNGENWYPGDSRAPSEATRQLVDGEIKALVTACYREAVALLGRHREQLECLAAALLAQETLDEHHAYRVAGIDHPEKDKGTPPVVPAVTGG